MRTYYAYGLVSYSILISSILGVMRVNTKNTRQLRKEIREKAIELDDEEFASRRTLPFEEYFEDQDYNRYHQLWAGE